MCVKNGGLVMVNAISSSSGVYPTNARAMDKVTQEQLYNPGLYALQDLLAPPPEKEKGGFISFLAKTIITAGVVGGALVLAKKSIDPKFLEELEKDAKLIDKVKHYAAKSGEWVEDTAKVAYGKLKDVFSKKAEPVAPPAEGGEAAKA